MRARRRQPLGSCHHAGGRRQRRGVRRVRHAATQRQRHAARGTRLRQVIDQYDFQLPDPFRALQPPLEPRTRAPLFDAFAMAFSADAWTLVLCVQEIEGDSLVASGVFVYSRAVASAECTTR
jgi:hypothetical protein